MNAKGPASGSTGAGPSKDSEDVEDTGFAAA